MRRKHEPRVKGLIIWFLHCRGRTGGETAEPTGLEKEGRDAISSFILQAKRKGRIRLREAAPFREHAVWVRKIPVSERSPTRRIYLEYSWNMRMVPKQAVNFPKSLRAPKSNFSGEALNNPRVGSEWGLMDSSGHQFTSLPRSNIGFVRPVAAPLVLSHGREADHFKSMFSKYLDTISLANFPVRTSPRS